MDMSSRGRQSEALSCREEELSLQPMEVLQGVLECVERGLLPSESGFQKSVHGQTALYRLVCKGYFPSELLAPLDYFQLSKHMSWNFLVQAIVVVSPPAFLESICVGLRGKCLQLSSDPVGYKVLCRICEHGSHLPEARKLLRELVDGALALEKIRGYSSYVLGKVIDRLEDFPDLEPLLRKSVSEAWASGRRGWRHVLCRATERGKLSFAAPTEEAVARSSADAKNRQLKILRWAAEMASSVGAYSPTSISSEEWLYFPLASYLVCKTAPGKEDVYALSHFDLCALRRVTWSIPLFDEELFRRRSLPFLHLGLADFGARMLSATVVRFREATRDSFFVQVRCLHPPEASCEQIFFCAPTAIRSFGSLPFCTDLAKPFYLQPDFFEQKCTGEEPVRKSVWSLLVLDPSPACHPSWELQGQRSGETHFRQTC
jgi:hypothetical protein